jgi:hypothetical protein
MPALEEKVENLEKQLACPAQRRLKLKYELGEDSKQEPPEAGELKTPPILFQSEETRRRD